MRVGAFDYPDERGFERGTWAQLVVVVEGALGGSCEACVALEGGVQGWVDCFAIVNKREHRMWYQAVLLGD